MVPSLRAELSFEGAEVRGEAHLVEIDRAAPMVSLPHMKISARNQLPGTVVSVEQGAVMSIVKIRLTGGEEVVAAITKDSVSSLELAVGDEVFAVIKSTEVMIAKE
jgi:molybdate transport system regulatory protein